MNFKRFSYVYGDDVSELIIKSCPFCGGEPKIKLLRSFCHKAPYFLIRCQCGVRMTNFKDSAAKAIADWNSESVVFDMKKVKTYEFWMVQNKMYASKTIKRVRWWNKWLIMSGCIVLAKCKFKAIDITDDDAIKIAKIEFEEDGYYEEIMGVRV